MHSSSSVPRIVDWYMEGKIDIDDLISDQLPLERINESSGLMPHGRVERKLSALPALRTVGSP
jgi:S-(hydroxymethyl)glutathione dehydrogenase / alcohol dehydrogenase